MTSRAHRRYPVFATALCVALVARYALPQELPSALRKVPAAEAAPEGGKVAPAGEKVAPAGEQVEAPAAEKAEPESKVPLYQQDAYDLVTLDKLNENRVLKVLPLDLPNRRVPDPLPRSGQIEVKLLEDLESKYVILWTSIDRIQRFHDLVLDEADELVRAGDLDRAYDYFQFLLDADPELPRLQDSIDAYLYEEAKASQREGQVEEALAMLRELHERNPQWAGLDKALGVVTGELVGRYVEADDYWTARQMLRNLAELYPDHPVVAEWEGRFQAEAGKMLEEGRKAHEAGKLRDAHAAGRRLMHVWPDLPGGKAFIDSVQRQYPRVVVGVTLPAADHQPGRLHDWASRRSSRLVCRTLMEFVGRGTEGGEYYCPFGEMEIQELGLRLAFQIDPDRGRSVGAGGLTGYDLARRLLAMADPRDAAYRLDWADLVDRVSPREVYGVDADLRRSHVRPEALLRSVVLGEARPLESGGASDSDEPSGPRPSVGPYLVESRSEKEVVYVANPECSLGAKQPKEIVERHYPKATGAVQALERRQIDVLDRVNPWDLERVKAIDGVTVEPYSLPVIHCLVPNPAKPFTARRSFCRALVYGIHREGILNHLLRGRSTSGCQVVSGPFSPGISPNDPLDYAYDHAIPPRGYEPYLAIALAQVALSEVAEAMKKKGIEVTDIPELVLAHPAHELARVACTSIQRQLKLVEIPVTLRELPSGVPARIPDDVDLLYVELTMAEPVVDAGRLLGEDGISGSPSNFMGQALRQLDQATDWAQVASRLRYIHWLTQKEVCIVPLWQLIDHFAYERSLKGAGPSPVSLYQNVERWEPATRYATEQK